MDDEEYCLLMAQVDRARRDSKGVDYWNRRAGEARRIADATRSRGQSEPLS